MIPFCVQLWTKVLYKQSGNKSGFLFTAPVQVLKKEGNRKSEGNSYARIYLLDSPRFSETSSVALQPGVGLVLLYNTPPILSIPCSVSPFVYSHLSQVRGHVIQPSHFWSSSSSCCIQLYVHLFLGLQCLAFFLRDQAIVFFGI